MTERATRSDGHTAPRPTIEDVARRAGVSTATVSRALRDHPHVTAGTRKRVVDAATELHYVANPNASRLASGHSRTIGVLAPLLTTWYTFEVLAGVEEVLAAAQYDVVIGTANPIVRNRIFRGDATFRQLVDGVLLVDVYCAEAGARQLAALDIPTVVLGERLRAVSSMSIDNHHGARIATAHLTALGHTRIALVGGAPYRATEHNVPSDRRFGFIDQLGADGIEWSDELYADGGFTIAGGHRAAMQLFDLEDRPTAIFCMSDEMAFGVLQAAKESGIAVPDELSVVGFDDHPAATAFGLTTVRQPVRQMGRGAADVLLGLVARSAPAGRAATGPRSVGHHSVEVELICRTSTGPRTKC
jgi:LacI family transcriptional regulator, repressor for deo operon, udp, cdd, tsx, nupC, and nupG